MPLTSNAFQFMSELYENNRKEWFDANRTRYEQDVREPIKQLASALSGPMMILLPEFNGKAKISRINNDIRFQPHKPPYKEHVWVSFTVSGASKADIFAAIGRHGWAAGCGMWSQKQDDLNGWRKNLLSYADVWRSYARASGLGEDVGIYIQDKYKKPQAADVPADLEEFVQAKEVWLVQSPRMDFVEAPERHLFEGLGIILPYFLFMIVGDDQLDRRLRELGDKIGAPSPQVARLWAQLHPPHIE